MHRFLWFLCGRGFTKRAEANKSKQLQWYLVTKLAKNSARDYKNAMVKVNVLQQATQPIFEI